ncbi:transporter substrate-binding domain-containing protein [Vibrio sp. S4M6]|uniref:substrate-binding periplasmic protein n=1 Tax=Vibrio sinus TaxID=2946865 RepID=UPI00202AB3B3|nr:transporter substrate-binding domain-containing protein [Vibrio sinus]MCL9782750.1 transporter substrate-binding domain-containing protein [Vibrio sinus]
MADNFMMKYFLLFLLLSPHGSLFAYESIIVSTIELEKMGYVENKKGKGFFYDVANLVAMGSGLEPENTIKPYARVLDDLKSGSTDISILFKNDSLLEHVTYISPIFTFENVVYGTSGKNFQSLKDLEGSRIAVLRGANYSDAFDKNTLIIKVPVKSYEQGISLLLSGRVNGIVGTKFHIESVMFQKNLPINKLSAPLTISTKSAWIQISKDSKYHNQEDIDRLRKSAESIVQSELFKGLVYRYSIY